MADITSATTDRAADEAAVLDGLARPYRARADGDARQRAVLALRDVLEFGAAERATVLGTTTASVTSALERARATLASLPSDQDGPDRTGDRPDAVERYVAASEAADVDGRFGRVTTRPGSPASWSSRTRACSPRSAGPPARVPVTGRRASYPGNT